MTTQYQGRTTDAAATSLRAQASQGIEAVRERLIALSHNIHGHPELAFHETRAAHWVSEELAASGFAIETGAGGLATAFCATYGTGDLTIGICAEYDALPRIGHACGHNIIAATSVGAAIGLSAVADELGIRIKVIGTPAEEQGAGKAILLERGVFDDVSVAMMAHPGSADIHPRALRTLCASRFSATYRGRAAHATAPELGHNAADAAVVAQVAIGLLRQQLGSECRIGLFVRKGGETTNTIPEETVVDCETRALDTNEFDTLNRRVLACFEAGALASGTTLEIDHTEPTYLAMRQDPILSDLYAANITALGRQPLEHGPFVTGSSDMGNVSAAVPSIHPWIAIPGCESLPHTREFTEICASPAADDTVVTGALALAFTGLDLALDPAARTAFVEAHRTRPAPNQ